MRVKILYFLSFVLYDVGSNTKEFRGYFKVLISLFKSWLRFRDKVLNFECYSDIYFFVLAAGKQNIYQMRDRWWDVHLVD